MSARVLVLNTFVKGWNILKRLADDGFEVNAGHHTPDAPGLFSNRVKDKTFNLIYPNAQKHEDDFVASVLAHIQKYKFDVLLPVNAAEMMALARYKTEIEKYAHFPFENYFKLMLLHDKKYFNEFVTALAGDDWLPRTWSIGDRTPPFVEMVKQAGMNPLPHQEMENFETAEHFITAYPGLLYPLIVKTRRATSSVGVSRAHDPDQLKAACGKLGGVDIIVQENITGRGVGISSLRWDRPAMMHHFGHKRVREFPISGGASTSREPWDTNNSDSEKVVTKILEKLDWHGVVMFEFKEVVDSGGLHNYRFLEANPRFWGSVPLAMANGVNFPALLCRATLGMEIPQVVNRKKIRARILFSDTLSLVMNVLHGRRIWYNLTDYFKFWNLFLDDIDWRDLPGTMKIFRRMLIEFKERIIRRK